MAYRKKQGFDNKAGFGQVASDGNGAVQQTILKQARKSGQLNLSNRALGEVPSSVWRINTDVPEDCKTADFSSEDHWWDQVDLTKLILASNQLLRLSEEIQLLPALTVLDVHDNQLSNLPEALGGLINLQKLNLSHNKLTELPQCLSRLKNLQYLHLEYNELNHLGDHIGELLYLEELDLSHNHLTTLPASIGFLSKVMRLNLSHNNLQALTSEMNSMRCLRVLECTHNQLQCLPDDLGQLSKLEQLYLRHNKLTHLPLLLHCSNLKELHVGNNAIQGLTPAHLEAIPSVVMLDLRDNKITKLPEEITLLEKLERIDLTNNDISALPYTVGMMTNLKSIVLDGNPMRGIRRDIIMRGTTELKKYLRSRLEEPVSVSTSKPAAVKLSSGTSGVIGGTGEGVDPHTVNSTKVLDYSNKKVTEIPSDLWTLAAESSVTVVNFSKNQLASWPSSLSVLSETLKELNLGVNKFSTVDSGVGVLTHLTLIDLRNNQLSDLPDSMSSLTNLREIIISFNRFNQFPRVLYDLKSLEVILAADNQIQLVDASKLNQLSKLATLDLQNNDIMQVPPELGLCTQLRSLQLEGNPFRQPRRAILAKGTLALLEYLQSRIPAT